MKIFLLVFLFFLTAVSTASAHELRPAYLQLSETQPGKFQSVWKVPRRGDRALRLNVVWPASCKDTVPVSNEKLPDALIEHRVLDCPRFVGESITIDGLNATFTDALVRIEFLDGRVQTSLIKASSPNFLIERRQTLLEVAGRYLQLGIEHILFGADHLLFVLGLLLIVSNRWMLVKTVTSFTAAHSITLAVTVLGNVHVPVRPVEASIALSILFLGPEIVKVWRGETSLTVRHPWLIAFIFGLLHGLGFAGALIELGLPQVDLPLALLSFNLGVEIGQLAFVLFVLLLERFFAAFKISLPLFVKRAPGYFVGSMGAFWTIQRIALMFGWGR